MKKNLFILMKQNKVTNSAVAKLLSISLQGLQHKLLGETEFKANEMFAIRNKFFPDKSLEEIFGE